MEGETDVLDAPRPQGVRQRCCSWGLGWKTLVWLVVVVVYLLFGGLIFMLAERPNEIDSVNAVVAQRKELARLLEEGKEVVTTMLMASGDNMTASEAAELIELVVNVSTSLALASQELQAETSPLWTYTSSVLFSTTVITTIGYGNTAPVTATGRILFTFYALLGIPTCLIFLSLVGEMLSHLLDSVTRCVAKRMKTRPATHQVSIQAMTILLLFITGLILFILFPSLVFHVLEDWTYGEAVYYCFVTLTTVGFGDFVPTQQRESDLAGFYRICSATWVLVGLAWVALLITKTQNALEKIGPFIGSKVRKVKEKREKKKQGQLHELVPPETTKTEAPEEEERGARNREGGDL